MRVLYEVGDTVAWRVYPDDASIQMDQPMRGWMKVSVKGELESWFRLDRVIAVVPDERVIAMVPGDRPEGVVASVSTAREAVSRGGGCMLVGHE